MGESGLGRFRLFAVDCSGLKLQASDNSCRLAKDLVCVEQGLPDPSQSARHRLHAEQQPDKPVRTHWDELAETFGNLLGALVHWFEKGRKPCQRRQRLRPTTTTAPLQLQQQAQPSHPQTRSHSSANNNSCESSVDTTTNCSEVTCKAYSTLRRSKPESSRSTSVHHSNKGPRSAVGQKVRKIYQKRRTYDEECMYFNTPFRA